MCSRPGADARGFSASSALARDARLLKPMCDASARGREVFKRHEEKKHEDEEKKHEARVA
jgi:hypothetical protein